jgi:serine/threonine protein kinase
MQILGSGGYGSVVALDEHRVCKLQASDEDGRAGISTAALREMVALRVLEKVRRRGRRESAGVGSALGRVGRILLHPSGVVGIEIRRYPLSLLDWLRGRKQRQRTGNGRSSGALPLASPSRILGVIADVAAELAMAHAHGYIHRDVKPENVMLDAAGRAHLIDWGMSRFVPGGAAGRWTPGVATVWYRAPELFTGDAYGAAVDIWALGVMVVELVTGRCPFRGRTELEQTVHYAEVLGPPPADRACLPRWPFARTRSRHEPCRAEFVWAQVPEIAAVPGLPDLVDRMLRWRPEARATAAELLLHPALRAAAPRSCPPPSSARATPGARVPLPSLARAAALRSGVRKVILPGCLALGAPLLPVGWCAALLLWRVLAAARSASAVPALAPLLCTDLAAKLVGTQTRARGLLRSASATRRQVHIVNRYVGVPGLADGAERSCAPLLALAEAASRLSLPPGSRPMARLLLEAALLAAPERILANEDWRRLAPCLLHLAHHVLTGLAEPLSRCRAAAKELVRARGATARAALRAFPAALPLLVSARDASPQIRLWRRAAAADRTALIADLQRDPVRAHRLAAGLAAIAGRMAEVRAK